jgi:chromosome partitioning protein
MAHVFAISNQKGGVGKTTSVVNLAAFCALAGRRTLVIDNDPQGNASSVLAERGAGLSVYRGGKPRSCTQSQLSIIVAGEDLLEQELALSRQEGGRLALKRAIAPLLDHFDIIFIDCPPNLSLLPINALLAADKLIVPLQCEYFALEGLSQLLAYVEELKHSVGITIELAAILLTMYDDRYPLAQQIEREVRQHFKNAVLASKIPRDLSLAAAPSHGKTILDYDPLSTGGISYLSASKELLDGLE